MKKVIMISLLLLAAALLLPAAVAGSNAPDASSNAPGAAAAPEIESAPPTPSKTPAPVGQADSEIVFTALIEGEARAVTMADYLPGALAGEMPASFEPQALRAQAVAARTYILYRAAHTSSRHPEADVCGDPACCKAYLTPERLRENWGDAFEQNWQSMSAAVLDTDGQYLVWDGEPIQAVFHSSSSAQTEASGNLWQEVPYLVSVASPETGEDVPNFVSTVEVTAEDFKNTVLMLHSDAYFDGNPLSWLGEISVYDSGRVESVKIGGVTVPGNELRTMFSLRSTAFSLDCTGESFLFTVRGYGHGVGMSQWGANIMAREGSGYAEILAHYYPGTTLVG